MSDWAFSVMADPDYTRVVDPDLLDDVVPGAAAAAWRPRALSWWNDAPIGDAAHMSPVLQLFSRAQPKLSASPNMATCSR